MTTLVDSVKSLLSTNVITGTSSSNTITGTAKNDVIIGKGGNDALNGGTGNDIVLGGKGNDDLGGSAGKDLVIGGAGNDVIRGGTDKDLLIGGSGNDLIVGGSGDKLWGGRGADVFRIDPTGVKNTILDFSFKDGDRIDIPRGYSLANAKIVDNGWSIFGVTVTFFDGTGAAGPVMQILGVNKASDVISDWFV